VGSALDGYICTKNKILIFFVFRTFHIEEIGGKGEKKMSEMSRLPIIIDAISMTPVQKPLFNY
jgi:hypothetical protein